MAPSAKAKRLPNFKLLHEREQARVERFKVRDGPLAPPRAPAHAPRGGGTKWLGLLRPCIHYQRADAPRPPQSQSR